LPLPTWNDLERFCELDGWDRREGDHIRFRKQLDDGRILRTKMSHKGADTIGPGLWTHIWRTQLALQSEADFWHALETREPVVRDVPEAREPKRPGLPAWLWQRLIEDVGLGEDEVKALSEEEALARLHALWARARER